MLFALCHSAAFSADAPKSKIVLESTSGMELPIPDANGAEIGAFSFSKIGWITPYRIFLFKVNAVKIPVFENAKLVFAKIPDKKITPADFDFTPMQFAPFEVEIGDGKAAAVFKNDQAYSNRRRARPTPIPTRSATALLRPCYPSRSAHARRGGRENFRKQRLKYLQSPTNVAFFSTITPITNGE